MNEQVYNVVYGRDLIEEHTKDYSTLLVVTDEDIWDKLGDKFANKNVKVYFMKSMEREFMDEEVKKISGFDCVVGFGGGIASDGAKLWAEYSHKPLIQIPTAISVNAFIVYKTAVRYKNVVKYEGHNIPEAILIDFNILENTPKKLNISGIGDLISSLTASYDWKINSLITKSHKFNQEIYDQTQDMLSLLAENIDDIVKNNEKGIRFLVEAYRSISENSYKMRHTMWEDGSEHNFFMNLERITEKPFLHGQVICLGVYMMSAFQDNQHERAVSMIRRSTIDITPDALGVTISDIKEALFTLNDFVEEEGIRYSICNAKKVTNDWVEEMIRKYKADFNIA